MLGVWIAPVTATLMMTLAMAGFLRLRGGNLPRRRGGVQAWSPGRRLRLQQALDPDRQLPPPLARGVEDRIGDRRVGADIAQLAQALDAQRIDLAVLLLDEQDLHLGHVG